MTLVNMTLKLYLFFFFFYFKWVRCPLRSKPLMGVILILTVDLSLVRNLGIPGYYIKATKKKKKKRWVSRNFISSLVCSLFLLLLKKLRLLLLPCPSIHFILSAFSFTHRWGLLVLIFFKIRIKQNPSLSVIDLCSFFFSEFWENFGISLLYFISL